MFLITKLFSLITVFFSLHFSSKCSAVKNNSLTDFETEAYNEQSRAGVALAASSTVLWQDSVYLAACVHVGNTSVTVSILIIAYKIKIVHCQVSDTSEMKDT